MYIRFYGTGVCFGNCTKAHTVLDQDEKNIWHQFITHCRKNHDKWLESINSSNDNESPDDQQIKNEKHTNKKDDKT